MLSVNPKPVMGPSILHVSDVTEEDHDVMS